MDEPLPSAARRQRQGGQSLVEFTLVLPIMLLLLITVADFGRLFAAGITIESAARTGAETAAGHYLVELRLMPGQLPPLTNDGYTRVHRAAWESVCDEAAGLPNAAPGALGAQCTDLPTLVCVHDGYDPSCGSTYNQGTGGTAGCPNVAAASSNLQTGGTEASKYVEVRVCYRFSTMFSLTIPSIGGGLSPLGGDFYLERVRTFTVADY